MNVKRNSISSQLIDEIEPYLLALGLDEDQARTYLYLLGMGQSSVMALAKAQGSGRTRLYPILESLVDLQLVKVDQKHYGTTYEALSPQSLEYLVTEKETKVKQLRNDLLDVTARLSQLSGSSPAISKVIEYRGVDGLKQINFNLTKAHEKCYVIEGQNLHNYETMPPSFVERIRKIFFEKKLMVYDLTNDKNMKPVKSKYNPKAQFQTACYIDPDIFKIKTETYIYNDVVAYLRYEKNEPFGVEIYNQDLADQQKQMYELLWSKGTVLY